MAQRGPSRCTLGRNWSALALLLILALAIGLRFFRLGAQSLWNDEGTSVALAQRDLVTIARHASQDIHPPLYYYLLHFWLRLFGTTEASVRGLSAMLGSLAVWATYWLAHQLRHTAPDRRAAALLAALFVALSPFQVYYSQEARMYILVTAFGLLSMATFVSLVRRLEGQEAGRTTRLHPTWALVWPLAAYLLTTTCAVYSHYFAFSLVLAQNVAFAAWLVVVRAPSLGKLRGRAIAAWASAQLLVALAYLPWLIVSWGSLTRWPSVSQPLSLFGLLRAVSQVFALGVTMEPGRLSLALSLLLSALAGLPVIWLLAEEEPARRERLWGVLTCALYAVAPVVVIYLLSLSRPMYKPKFLLLATPGYHILQAWGVAILRRLAMRRTWGPSAQIAAALLPILVVLGVSSLSLSKLYADPAYRRDDYRGIVTYIQATARADDALIINAPSQIETVDYYYRGPWPEYPLPRQRPPDVAETERELAEIISRHGRLYAIFWATDESDPLGVVESWLDRHCFKALDSWFGNLRLVVYAVPQAPANEMQSPRPHDLGEAIRLQGYTLLTPSPAAGDILQVTLFWEARSLVAERYKVFTHLVDQRGNIVAQRDGEPVGGSRPTTGWQPGELIRDNYGIAVPPGTFPGEHVLRIGMYHAETGARLQVTQPGDSSTPLTATALDLARVEIAPSSAPPPLAALGRQHPHYVSWSAVTLVGHSLYRLGAEHEPDLALGAGDVAKLELYWRIEGPVRPEARAYAAELVGQGGATAWRQELTILGDDAVAWRPGDLARDIHQLPLPADLPAGRYRLSLGPVGPGELYTLARVQIN